MYILRFTSTHFDGELIHDMKKHVSSIVNDKEYNLHCRSEEIRLFTHIIYVSSMFVTIIFSVGTFDMMLNTATECFDAIENSKLAVQGYYLEMAGLTDF